MALVTATKTERKAINRVVQAELPVDNYPCRVAQIIDLGLHHKDVWDDTSKKFIKATDKAPVNMLMLTYEFTTEFMKDEAGNDVEDKPRWLSEDFPVYALDSDLATSTKRYNAFDPGHVERGNWAAFAGAPCAVTIAHKKSGKAKVGNVAKPMKGMVVADLKNPVKVFDLAAPDLDVFNSLPEWLRDRIKSNLEFEGSKLQSVLESGPVGQGGQTEKTVEKPVQEFVEVPVDDDSNPW